MYLGKYDTSNAACNDKFIMHYCNYSKKQVITASVEKQAAFQPQSKSYLK